MPITNAEELEKSRRRSLSYGFVKTISGSAGAGMVSGWRSNSSPTPESSIPSGAVIPTHETVGAFPIRQALAGEENYLVGFPCQTSSTASPMTLLCDRLIQAVPVGYSPTVTTTQAVNASLADSALDARRGASDYSDVMWWFEVLTTLGSPNTAFVDMILDDDTEVNGVGFTVAGSSGKMTPIFPPTANRYIKEITSYRFNASFGSGVLAIVATRLLAESMNPQYDTQPTDFNRTGLPLIPRDAALMLMNSGVSGNAIANGALRISSA